MCVYSANPSAGQQVAVTGSVCDLLADFGNTFTWSKIAEASSGTCVLHLPTGCLFEATEMCFDPLPPTRTRVESRCFKISPGKRF